MSYSIYKNKKLLKELSDKDYRLLKFNSKLINPFHTYLMYSLVPSELNKLSFKDLNSVVEIFKKKINKFVKKKFNKNYVNANSQKDLDIFTELCHLNISIFNNNFDNLHSSTKNKKYTKRLYLINRDNDLFLLIKKDKKGLKLKLGNNVLKPIQSGGGDGLGSQKTIKKVNKRNFWINGIRSFISQEGPFVPLSNNYYDQIKVNEFLKTYCEKLIEKGKRTNEITDKIDNIIYPIEIIENYERFKIFKSLPIREKKKNSNFNARDELLKELKKIRKNKGKEFGEYKQISGDNFNGKQDIIGELENFKETKGKLNKEKLEHFKEIIIAAFTDYMRKYILESIKNIETDINLKMYNAGIKGYDVSNSKESVGERNPVRIVISGGSGFNNLIVKNSRPISPDIDVKLCLHTQEAIDLHKHMTQNKNVNQNVNMNKNVNMNQNVNMNKNVNDKNIENLQMVVAKQLLILRIHLFNAMKIEAEKLNKIIFKKWKKLNNMFNKLRKYCEEKFNDNKEIPFLKSLDPNVDEKWRKNFSRDQPVKVLVRETLMKRGIDGDPEENPYKLHDIFLYSLDLPFNGKTGFDSLAGILDIVVSIPGHIGYILPSYSTNTLSTANILGCYNITVDYYKYELIKLITYGLRTTNKKILKDLERYKILLKLDPELKGAKLGDLKNISQVINAIKDNTLKNELKNLLSGVMNVGLETTDEDLIVIQSDTQDSDEHLINLDEQCSSQEGVISQTSEDSEYDQKMRQMYIDLYADIDENGSLNKFVSDCTYHGLCYVDKGGGNKKKKQIGGAPCGNVEMLSLSKVFQLMVNNESMKEFNSFKSIKLVSDKNVDAFLNYYDDIPTINFEKLTEVKAKHPNHPNILKSKSNEWTNEYLSTKASDRVASFRMSTKVKKEIKEICNHLITEVIKKGNINKLCYCYENEDYKPEPGNPIIPSEQEYAAFLLTQCQVLNTINETKELYNTIYYIANPPKTPSRVAPNIRNSAT